MRKVREEFITDNMRRIFPLIKNYAIVSSVTPLSEWKCEKWNKISFDELKEQFKYYFSSAQYVVKEDYIEIEDKDFERYLDCYDNMVLINGKWKSGFDRDGKLIT